MDPARYNNRELSWLEFDQRVLDEARDPSVPLLERVKFLAIVSSNLDEFFMVRVAGLKRQVRAGDLSAGPDGLTPAEALAKVRARARELSEEQHRCWMEELQPALEQGHRRVARFVEHALVELEPGELAVVVARGIHGYSAPCRTHTSTRRLRSRPAGVSLDATGIWSPRPWTTAACTP